MKNFTLLKLFSIQSITGLTILMFVLILSTGSSRAQCASIDQSQLISNGGMSALNDVDRSEWQDFIPGVTGTLCQLDIGFFVTMTGTGILKIFSGTGTGGALLESDTVTVSGSGNFFQSFTLSTPVIAGSIYTFQFIPIIGGGLPSPYGVQIESPGTYAGGEMRITDPSGTYPTGFDMVFKTYISETTQIADMASSVNPVTISPNPFSSETILRSGSGFRNACAIVYNVFGQEVKTLQNINGNDIIIYRDGLESGMYFVSLVQGNKTLNTLKLIVID